MGQLLASGSIPVQRLKRGLRGGGFLEMAYTDYELNYVYDKNGGCCWHCGKRLTFMNYGVFGGRGAWEVDHSIPISRGGTSDMNNLVPACMPCNRSKGDLTSREFS